jgi:RND family efflux transporter MFP subunit
MSKHRKLVLKSDRSDIESRRTAASISLSRALHRLILAAAFVIAAGANESAMAQAAAPAPPPVTVSPPLQREIVEWNEYTGQFTAAESVDVRARVSGYLTEIHFSDGQFVKQGDLLFVIDPRPFEIALASAKAQVNQAMARLDLANRQLSRAAELRKGDAISASTYDERAEETRAATATVDVARAGVAAAELDMEFTHVTAPMAGHASRHLVSIGNLVVGGPSGNATLLTTIVSTDPIYCVFDISEADLLAYRRAATSGTMKVSQEIPLTLQARLLDDKSWTLKGQLNFVENQVDRGSDTLRVRAAFANPDGAILSGQFARVRVPASEPHQAMLVPDSALVSDQSRKLLMVVRDDGTVEPHVVQPGPLQDGLRVIRDGITPTDRVVIDGLVRARPGAKVTPQPGKIELLSAN